MTGPEVTAAMKAEDVPAGLVEKAGRAIWEHDNGHTTWPPRDPLEIGPAEDAARAALAAVLPHFAAVVAANTLEDAAENLDLPGSTAVGYYASEQHSGYGDAERDVERWLTHRAARIRAEDAARLTNATEEAK